MVSSDNVISAMRSANLLGRASDTPTSIPFCQLHYSEIYRLLQQPKQTNCATCGISLRHKTTRACPQPHKVERILREMVGFEGHLSEGQKVCYSCYKSHLLSIEQSVTISTDSELQTLINSVKQSIQIDKEVLSAEDVLSEALKLTIVKVGENLLNRQLMLLPAIHDFFNQCTSDIVDASDVSAVHLHEDIKVTSLWLLSELRANFSHHMICACKIRKYGTLMYRPDTDLILELQKALWKARHCEKADHAEHAAAKCDIEQPTSQKQAIDHNIFDVLNDHVHVEVKRMLAKEKDGPFRYDELDL